MSPGAAATGWTPISAGPSARSAINAPVARRLRPILGVRRRGEAAWNRTTMSGPRAMQYGTHGLRDDPEIEEEGAARDVFDVEPKSLVEGRFISSAHLPQPGYPGGHLKA